jgi:mannose-6-phosphate isomerase
MGSGHANGPSKVIKQDGSLVDLKTYILDNADAVYGKAVQRLTDTARKEGQVPFLFKTLCAGKTLPLQIHPNKKLAETLSKKWPKEDLPDSNHKPEIALALTDFQAFASFRPFHQIRSFVERVPELKEALGEMAQRVLSESPSEDLLRETVAHVSLAMLRRRASSR